MTWVAFQYRHGQAVRTDPGITCHHVSASVVSFGDLANLTDIVTEENAYDKQE